MKKLIKPLLLAGLAVSAAAQAANPPHTVTVHTVVIDASNDGTLSLSKFDPTLGTLQSVQVSLFGEIDGSTIGAENKNTKKSINVSETFAGLLSMGPIGGVSLSLHPSYSTNFTLLAYDGTTDYAGASGKTVAYNSGVLTASQSFSDAATLAMFTGPGNVNSAVTWTNQSTQTSASNLLYKKALSVYANADVTYTYTSAVPEPETYALMLAGLGLIGVVTRRRAS